MSFLKKRSFPVSVAVGVGIAVAITALLLLPVAAAISHGAVNQSLSEPLTFAIAGAAAFISTILVVRGRDKMAFPTGASIAGGCVVLAMLLCALAGERCTFGAWTLWLAVSVFAGGVFGAVAAQKRKSRRKRRR